MATSPLSRAGIAALAVLAITLTTTGEEVHLVGGDVINGEIVSRNDESVVIEHLALGTITIPVERVTAVGADEAAAAEAEAQAAEALAAQEKEKEWKSTLTVGATVNEGNTQSIDVSVAFQTQRESESDRTTFSVNYIYGSSDGDRDDNKLVALAVQDWFFQESKWFWFAQGRYDYDEFESWEHRAGVHTGPGYHLIERDDLTLDLRLGGGATKEWGSDDNDLNPEALLGYSLAWEINDRQKLTAATTVFPDLGDMGEFRVTNSATWNIMLNEESDWSLAFGLLHEYQSQVDPGNEKNDLRVTAGLQLAF